MGAWLLAEAAETQTIHEPQPAAAKPPVQALMKSYYSMFSSSCWLYLLERQLLQPSGPALFAGNIFPYLEMYEWLAYGNGEHSPQSLLFLAPPLRACSRLMLT